MKAAFVVEKEKVEIRDIEIPKIKNDEVLIKVKTVGVCGSDLHLFKGTHPFRKPPAILGHEVAGDIIEVGSNVKNLKIGDKVTVEPHIGCGECEFCKQDLINLCISKKTPGTPSWNGTFAEYFNAPEKVVHKINDKISYEMATLVEPLAVAVHAINRITVKEKDTLVILGSGTIGLLTLVAARESGYRSIICTDTQEFNLQMALKQGAILAINPLKEDVVQKVKEFTNGRGADVALIMADAKNIVDQAAAVVRKRGEVGMVSMITESIPVYPYSFVFNELTLFGAMTYETNDFIKAVEMINSGLDLSDFITQKIILEGSQKALNVLNEKKENVVKVIVEI
ncbi:MAG: alcohol dehydrogenase [Firmicutes bacterium HGW-Firmicutes-7]|nr:MAG: alcohol dehydrogenase [Firmicutes bacterium HGW-Firmicutes-7]